MSETEKRLEGKEILIVDDEPDVLDTLGELLPMCHVVKATTFEKAQKLLKSEHFDIAILDIMGVDGYKLLEIAKENDVIPVMLTAHALSIEDTIRSYKKGAAFYVPKDQMSKIATFLNDILEADEKGKSHWSGWLDRLGAYYERKFGENWRGREKDFWLNFPRW